MPVHASNEWSMLAMLEASRNVIEILKYMYTTSIKLGASILWLEAFIPQADDKGIGLFIRSIVCISYLQDSISDHTIAWSTWHWFQVLTIPFTSDGSRLEMVNGTCFFCLKIAPTSINWTATIKKRQLMMFFCQSTRQKWVLIKSRLGCVWWSVSPTCARSVSLCTNANDSATKR